MCQMFFSIVRCGQDCSRSVPLCKRANHTCAFVHHTTHLCVLCQHYLCAVSFSIVQCTATTHYFLQFCVAQCTAADTVLQWVRCTAHTFVTLFAWKLENVVQKCVSDLFKTYLCAVQFRVAMHCIVCGSAAVSVHPPATALPRPPSPHTPDSGNCSPWLPSQEFANNLRQFLDNMRKREHGVSHKVILIIIWMIIVNSSSLFGWIF